MTDAEAYRRRYERERNARLQAEQIAETAIADLVASNMELDRRVTQRTAELQSALERVEAADAVKSTFVRGLAHEMSTPMHAIHGLLELIDGRSTDHDVRSAAKHAAQATNRLNHALRTLLEFAALTSGDDATTRAPVRLGEYADRITSRWRLPAAREGLLLVTDVRPDPSTYVEVDEARLDQVVDALVDNAIRFGGTPIGLSVELIDQDRPRLRVVVTDNGPGIPVEMRERIFEAFERGDASTEGFGVGLTLARAIAGLLGGELELGPSDGARTVFSVEIPLNGGLEQGLTNRTVVS